MRNSFGFDALLLLSQHFYISLWNTAIPHFLPFIFQLLDYSQVALGFSFIGLSVFYLASSLIVKSLKPSSTGMYIMGATCLLSLLVEQIVLLLVPHQQSRIVQGLLICLILLCSSYTWIGDFSFVTVTLGKMFRSCNQTTVEGLRQSVQLLSQLVGSFFSPYIYEYSSYVFSISSFYMTSLLVGIFVRRSSLRDPKIRDGGDEESVGLLEDGEKTS